MPSTTFCRKKEAWKLARQALKGSLYAIQPLVEGFPLPGVQGAITTLLKIVEYIDMADANVEELNNLEVWIGDLKAKVCMPLKEPKTLEGTNLHVETRNLEKDLLKYASVLEARALRNKSIVTRLFKASSDADDLKKISVKISKLLETFVASAVVRIDESLANLQRITIENALMNELPCSQYASYKSNESDSSPLLCFENTRENVMKILQQWACNPVDAKESRIFWLHGRAGIGKSTIAHTFASYLDEKRLLGASFMFRRSGYDNSLKDAKMVIPTLAHQLAEFDSNIKAHITEALRAQKLNYHSSKLASQFKDLILDPLLKLSDNPARIIVIILDGLDESEPENLSAEILSLFFKHRAEFPFIFRILVTSRPEQRIRKALGHLGGSNTVLSIAIATENQAPDRLSADQSIAGYRELNLHDIPSEIVDAEIKQFVRSKLTQCWINIYESHIDQWPPDESLDNLVGQSGQLFIYAATIVRFIGDEVIRDPKDQLQIILGLKQTFTSEPFAAVDQLYTQIVQKALPDKTTEKHIERFQQIVGSVVLLRTPLSITALSRILNIYKEEEIRQALYNLHSVIIIPDDNSLPTLQVYHLAFTNFITNNARCQSPDRYISSDNHELTLFERCISVIGSLSRDASGPSPLELHEQYCYYQWSNHLRNVAPGNIQRDLKILEIFENLRKGIEWSVIFDTWHPLSQAALYHWKRDGLKRDPYWPIRQNNTIRLQFYNIKKTTHENDTENASFVPVGRNLCIDNKVNINITDSDGCELHYGFQLDNYEPNPELYISAYWFSDYYFRSWRVADLRSRYMTLPKLAPGDTRTFGYTDEAGKEKVDPGSYPLSFTLLKGQYSEDNLLRIFLSTEYEDHARLEEFMEFSTFDAFPPYWGVMDISVIQHAVPMDH